MYRLEALLRDLIPECQADHVALEFIQMRFERDPDVMKTVKKRNLVHESCFIHFVRQGDTNIRFGYQPWSQNTEICSQNTISKTYFAQRKYRPRLYYASKQLECYFQNAKFRFMLYEDFGEHCELYIKNHPFDPKRGGKKRSEYTRNFRVSCSRFRFEVVYIFYKAFLEIPPTTQISRTALGKVINADSVANTIAGFFRKCRDSIRFVEDEKSNLPGVMLGIETPRVKNFRRLSYKMENTIGQTLLKMTYARYSEALGCAYTEFVLMFEGFCFSKHRRRDQKSMYLFINGELNLPIENDSKLAEGIVIKRNRKVKAIPKEELNATGVKVVNNKLTKVEHDIKFFSNEQDNKKELSKLKRIREIYHTIISKTEAKKTLPGNK